MAEVLVAGGSGYLGTTLVRHLIAGGHSVRNLDINAPNEQPEGTSVVLGDVRDHDLVHDACDGVDTIYHTVAQQPLARDKALIESVTVDGTASLLRAARDRGVRKVIFLSSTAVFGIPRTNPVTESTPILPVEVYGRAKAAAEHQCRAAASEGLDVTIIRPRTIVGHGRLGLFAILFEWIADGAPVFVLGKGDNLQQFVHADDLAAACVLAARRPGPSAYNIGTLDFGTMRETLEALVKHAGTGSSVRSLPAAPAKLAMAGLSRAHLAPFGPYHWLAYGKPLWFDIGRARDDLGWEPRYSNEAMMIEAYDWFVEHRSGLSASGRSLHQSPARQGILRVAKLGLRLASWSSRR